MMIIALNPFALPLGRMACALTCLHHAVSSALFRTRTSIKPVLMAVKTLGITGTGSQTNLMLTRFDTKLSVF